MDEAQTLFREGVLAIRNNSDPQEGKRLLMQSLKLNPQNEMAWLWLARCMDDPRRQMDCIDRALRINPQNEQALVMREEILPKLQATPPAPQPAPRSSAPPPIVPDMPLGGSAPADDDLGQFDFGQSPASAPRPQKRLKPRKLTAAEERRIEQLFAKAEQHLAEGDSEAAIEQWVKVLQIQVDHEDAMRNAVRYLHRLDYKDDARELVWRALNAGTTHPSVYLTAIDISQKEGDTRTADDLRDKVVQLPEANESVVILVADYYIKTKMPHRAMEILTHSVASHPDSQKILIRLGDLHEDAGKEREAAVFFERAAQLGTRTKEGKAADKKLKDYVPIITDKERGSSTLAWREAAGFAVMLVLLGVQDAGLNLLNMGISRWLGVGLGVVGGYLLVTATSSPQQQPIARLLGGHVPEAQSGYDDLEHGGVIQEATNLPIIPVPARVIIGFIGFAILAFAFALVFSTALRLLFNPVEPSIPAFCDAIRFNSDELNQIIGC